jgi:hypothetical protein
LAIFDALASGSRAELGSLQPVFPRRLVETYGESGRLSEPTDEGQSEKHWLREELLSPPTGRQTTASQPQLVKPLRFAIDEGIETESLNEALQLACCELSLHQVHEVRTNAPFGKEALRFSRIGAFLQPEHPNLHSLMA